MDEAFTDIFNYLDDDPQDDNDSVADDEEEAIRNILTIGAINQTTDNQTTDNQITDEPTVDYDPEYNLLDDRVRDEFKMEVLMEENDIFTQSVSTTDTMEGHFSNTQFHERDLIKSVVIDERVVLAACNYGVHKYPGYTVPVKVKTTRRGRNKKEKKKKNRRQQGDQMNSQITFVVLSENVEPIENDPDDYPSDLNNNNPNNPNTNLDPLLVSPPCPQYSPYTIPYGAKVYKFKVFRPGTIQLPGVTAAVVDDVIECAKLLSEKMTTYMYGDSQSSKQCTLLHLNPVMRNYKFRLKLPEKSMVDLKELKRVLTEDRRNPHADKPIGVPSIYLIKYDREDTKLSIKFNTSIYKKPKKKTRINIFMRGKINILGAFAVHATKKICDYLYWIFKTFPGLIVKEHIPTPIVESNIDISYDEARKIIDNPSYSIEQADYDYLMKLVDAEYNEIKSTADNYLQGILNDICRH